MRSQNKTQHRKTHLYKAVFRDDVGSWPFFAKNYFFLIKLFLAILYEKSISDDFQGLCLTPGTGFILFSSKFVEPLFVGFEGETSHFCPPNSFFTHLFS